MASPIEDDVFERLKNKTDPAEQKRQQDELNARLSAQQHKSQERLVELIDDNTGLPVTISSVRVLHANRTRRGFLERVVNPLLSAQRDEPYTLEAALKEVGHATDKLNRFGIFKSPISVFLDRPDSTNASSSPTDIDVYISAHERGNYTIKTGTEAGASEADAYVHAELRNVLGGAETINAHGSLGTRTRSAYSLAFDTPILSNPDLKFQVNGFASSTLKSWASHEEVLKGGNSKLLWRSKNGHQHELGYSGIWRQVTSLAEKASPSVRADAGDSFKSSLTHTWINDKRDYPLLPSSGYLMKSVSELAGFGPLQGDVAFFKSEAESQIALPFGNTGITLTAGLRGGLLYPLTSSDNTSPQASRINDRFQLGGPNSVRGFRLGGIGPHDGPDAIGGDVYAAGGASLLLPLPRVGKETPLRLQAFINGGRSLALRGQSKNGDLGDVGASMKKTLQSLTDELPSAAAGLGLVYAHPVARFEINFSLPLVTRKEEAARKGLSFGVGIEFL
ncbi:mitochondrial outer membrane protein-like protein [Dothidotthia symphoricarpi CBS 119687]|uniref:Mitochondrial outer membrane protein-like protein n=1 Tax=Dothidotthia symphoricarpi CBS 119687 TaxID=1392245 RepID=A0A6A6AQE9_9PLEO|nr:mitochondrial outer membrane protein-like protein [Dothidotthia symphoricarpi CBS 119687]KAF2133174.1 mitochondrial outer membrane protein-like protein [Dothidotthia symphoricarpi CBS 119687]